MSPDMDYADKIANKIVALLEDHSVDILGAGYVPMNKIHVLIENKIARIIREAKEEEK